MIRICNIRIRKVATLHLTYVVRKTESCISHHHRISKLLYVLVNLGMVDVFTAIYMIKRYDKGKLQFERTLIIFNICLDKLT